MKKRQEFTNLKQRLWWRLTNKEEERRKIMNRIRDEVGRQRKKGRGRERDEGVK